jgi:hypothetical protein
MVLARANVVETAALANLLKRTLQLRRLAHAICADFRTFAAVFFKLTFT